MSKFRKGRINVELSRLPIKIDNIDIDYFYIKLSDLSINLKINKDFRNLIVYINNITIPEDYPFIPLCLDSISIIICEEEKILAKLNNKNEIIYYFKNQIDYSKGFCDYYNKTWSPALTIKTFSLMLSHDIKFMISKKLDIEKEIMIKEIIEYNTNHEINEVACDTKCENEYNYWSHFEGSERANISVPLTESSYDNKCLRTNRVLSETLTSHESVDNSNIICSNINTNGCGNPNSTQEKIIRICTDGLFGPDNLINCLHL